MKIALICFTEQGYQTEKKLTRLFSAIGHEAAPFVLGEYAKKAAANDNGKINAREAEKGVGEWAKSRFSDSDALVFIGACGIAVRAVAPYVEDKKTDPAVLVVDADGNYVIPLLSGHLGGANELAVQAARGLSAQPVITTATDIHHRFSVDMFAKKHGLAMDDMKMAKAVSADVLAGEQVGLFCDFPTGKPDYPELLSNTMCRHNIWITISNKGNRVLMQDRMLRLVPKCVVAGIGCRRETPLEKLREVLYEAFESHHLDPQCLCALASIDIKKEESGLIALAQSLKIPFLTWSKEELESMPGVFSDSQFVRQTVGVGNVCERAAMAACTEVSRASRLLFEKWARDGVTVAAAYFVPELFPDSAEDTV